MSTFLENQDISVGKGLGQGAEDSIISLKVLATIEVQGCVCKEGA